MAEDKFQRIFDEIGRGHKDLGEIRKDITKGFEKMEQHKEELIECKKDIEHIKELMSTRMDDQRIEFADKFKSIKKDVDELWGQFRVNKEEVKRDMSDYADKEYVKQEILKGNTALKLWGAIVVIVTLANIIALIMPKLIGG